MTGRHVDGPTMWARWNAFDDSGYQELVARERNRERQRLERIRTQRQETMWWGVAALLLFIFCLAAWGGAFAVNAQPAGYQIQQKIDDQWQVFRTPKGNYAQPQSEVVCNLDLASAVNIMPSGTILACRRAIRQPIPIQRAQGN